LSALGTTTGLSQQPEKVAALISTTTSRHRPARKGGKDNKTAYLMIAPMVILLGIFVIWPLIYAIYLSTFKISFYLPSQFVGLEFYADVLQNPDFWHSLGVGFYFALLTVPAGLVLALLIASFIKTLSLRLAGFLKTTVYVPAVVSAVIASVLFVFIYQDQGFANWFVGLFKLAPVAWLDNPLTALPAIAIPALWLSFGLSTLIMLAGLLDIPESYYESASLDGAGFFKKTFYITIPLLKNVLLYLLVTGFLLAIQQLELPLVMTNGGPVNATQSPNLYIFNEFLDTTPFSTSFSITAALLLFVVLGIISAIIFRLVNSDKAVDG
jgi:multiple sugar transport system permease protein